MDDPLFLLMVGNPCMVKLDPVDVIFPSAGNNAAVEEFCVRVTLFQICDPSTLALSSPLKHRKAIFKTHI